MTDKLVPLLNEDDFWLDIGTGEALLVEGDESPPGGGRRGFDDEPYRRLPLQPRRGLPKAYLPPPPPPPPVRPPAPVFDDPGFRKNVKATDLMLELRDSKKRFDQRFEAERQAARKAVADEVARKRAEAALRRERDEED